MLPGDEVGEVGEAGEIGGVGEAADLRRDLNEYADDKAGHAPRVVSAISASAGPVASAGVPSYAPGFLAAFVVVLVYLARSLLGRCPAVVVTAVVV